MSTSYRWEGKGRYGSCRFPSADERVDRAGRTVNSLENIVIIAAVLPGTEDSTVFVVI